MKSSSSRQHTMDVVFPMALLVVFLLSAMLVLLLAADLYGRITARSDSTNHARIAGAYLTEKVRQNGGTVRADGDLLILENRENDVDYCTYIYVYQDSLRELMMKKEAQPELDRGREILPLAEFHAEQAGERLLHFSCRDDRENTTSDFVAVPSVGG